jgi:predicted TPR repeat methyltransferase
MASSNMNLGVYHLYKRNYNDSIFRFQLVDRFLDPNNKKANYWLGWCYLLKSDHKKSIVHLAKAEKEDTVKLLDFVKSIDKTKTIPEQIYKIHRDITAETFANRFFSESKSLPKELVMELNNNISKLSKEYTILELGSNLGALSFELNERMQDKMHLTSTEISKELIKLQSEFFPKKSRATEVIETSNSEFFKSNKQKYDIICSLNGFAFDADLTEFFTKITSHLKPSGYFAFAIKLSKNETHLSSELEFSYNEKDLSKQLAKAKLQIISSKEISLEIKNNYSIFVCTITK